MNKKDFRINRIIKGIEKKFYNGKKNDPVDNVRTMKVGIAIGKISPEMKNRLDKLLDDADKVRREILIDLMNKFYQNPQQLIDIADKINTKTDKKTGEINIIHKFSSQKLYGKLYTKYAKGNIRDDYSSALFYESVLFNVAKEVCSFLDKYYTIQDSINKTIKENEKILEENKTKSKICELLKTVSNKKENDKYNKIIKQNNILINLYNQQYSDEKDELEFLNSLKGFPSFPLVERKAEVDYQELNEIFEPHLDKCKKFWNNINKEQMENAMGHFYRRNIYKWFQYYYKLDAKEPTKENDFKYELNNFSQSHSDKDNIEIILERLDKKVNRIDKIKDIEKITDIGRKQKIEWLRSKSLVVFEYLRQNKLDEFSKVRAEFDLKSSINAGFISKSNVDRKVYEIIGINEGKKSAILVDNIGGKNYYSFAFNVSKDNGKFKIDDTGKYKGYVNYGGSKKKPKDGEDNEIKNTQLKNINLDTVGAFILPLKFGKRYAREYLYNNQLNFENGGIVLNNAKIIKENNKYFVAITFTKQKGNKFKKDSIKPEHIIGVDRGEVLPVAVAITDLQGKLIKYPQISICEDFSGKQKEIDDNKKNQQSIKGKYDDNLKKKAGNLAKATVEKIAIELLYYVNKCNAFIVLENLSREFGVDPIMAKRQYSKIEDCLTKKLKENGLMYGRYDINTNTKDGFLAKVDAKYTSKTCCDCGCVFTKEKLENLEPYLKDNIYCVKLDDKEISMDIDYEIYIRKTGKKEKFNANDKIRELKAKNTKENDKLLKKILVNALNPRKTQAEFICPCCGHRQNADQQAGLNIARKWLFIGSPEYQEYKKKKDKKEDVKVWEFWEKFYKRNKRKLEII